MGGGGLGWWWLWLLVLMMEVGARGLLVEVVVAIGDRVGG